LRFFGLTVIQRLHWFSSNFPRSATTVAVAGISVLIGGLLLIYWPGLSGPFIFDDFANLVENSSLAINRQTLIDWRSAAFSSAASALGRPIAMLSFAMQYELGGGLSSEAAKAGNLVVHCICTFLVFGFVTALAKSPFFRLTAFEQQWLPLLAAAIWGLAPLHVSTVLYPVQRMAQLSALFSLAGLWVFVHYRNRWLEHYPSIDQLAACALWFSLVWIAGIFSKENAILLPWLVLLTELVFYRGFLNRAIRSWLAWLSWSTLLLATAVLVLYFVLKWDWVTAGYDMRPYALSERVLTELRIMWSYVGWFLLPDLGALGMFHDDYALSTAGSRAYVWSVWAGLAWLAAILVAVLTFRRAPELLYAIVFFWIGHVLESTILALELIFEHRNYFPTVGIAMCVAGLSLRAVSALGRVGYNRLAMLPVFAYCAVLALTAVLRSQIWSSELELSRAAVEHHPDSERSGLFYANALLREGLKKEGIDERNDLRMQYLALARHEFELTYQRNEDSLALAIMLFILDEELYPELGSSSIWLKTVEDLLATRTLSPTDFAAMNALVSCYESGSCSIPVDRVVAMTDQFERRFWQKSDAVGLSVRIMKAHDAGADQVVARLRAALDADPGEIQLRFQLIEALLRDSQAAEANVETLLLMQADGKRRQLPAIRDIFSVAGGR
jgi:hypothetical protein